MPPFGRSQLRGNHARHGTMILYSRRKRRQLGLKAKKSRLEVHRQMFAEQCQTVVKLINQRKSEYYHSKLPKADCKGTFKVMNSLLSYNVRTPLPPATSDKILANEFGTFFHDKFQEMRQELDRRMPTSTYKHPSPDSPVPLLANFQLQTPSDICKIINKCTSKSCPVDIIPTSFIKNNVVLQAAAPVLTVFVNMPLTSGVFRYGHKRGLVTPLLKKTGLDVNSFSNYRPVQYPIPQ